MWHSYKKIFYPRVSMSVVYICLFQRTECLCRSIVCVCICVCIMCVCVRSSPDTGASFFSSPGAVVIGNVLSGRQRGQAPPSWVADCPAGALILRLSTESLPSPRPSCRGRQSCQRRSMSLYFLRRMETWSLNRSGSSLIWEWTSGMPPNQLANLFMHVCR